MKLSRCLRLIVYKYHEGNVKRTLKRKLQVPEIAGMKANDIMLFSKIAVCRHQAGCISLCTSVLVWVFSVSCFACNDEAACQYQTCISYMHIVCCEYVLTWYAAWFFVAGCCAPCLFQQGCQPCVLHECNASFDPS